MSTGCSCEEKNDSPVDIKSEDANNADIADDIDAVNTVEDAVIDSIENDDADVVDVTMYKDPGKGPWEQGTPEYCKIDPTKFNNSAIDPYILSYAIFRHGKLCYIQGEDIAREMTTVTMTLGATMVGRAAYLTRDIQRTGPGTGPIMHTDLGTDWIATPTYPNRDATIGHILAFVAGVSPSLAENDLTFRYLYNSMAEINDLIAATEKCISQIPGLPTDAESFVQQEIFDRMGMTSSSWKRKYGIEEMLELFNVDLSDLGMNPSDAEEFVDLDYGIVSGWKANLSDMGKIGTLLLHEGWYGNERLLSREWVYRMSHPAFESANTAFGYLTWLNHRGNAFGVLIELPEFYAHGDLCAPAAFWPQYPHPPSQAQDCKATVDGASCTQKYDVGVFFAAGALDWGGAMIAMHPGLDMVIALHIALAPGLLDFGPQVVWDAILPGVVAMDPNYNGDKEAFCRDYGAGNYAPDLVTPRFKP